MRQKIKRWFKRQRDLFIFNYTKQCNGLTGFNEECSKCKIYKTDKQFCNM